MWEFAYAVVKCYCMGLFMLRVNVMHTWLSSFRSLNSLLAQARRWIWARVFALMNTPAHGEHNDAISNPVTCNHNLWWITCNIFNCTNWFFCSSCCSMYGSMTPKILTRSIWNLYTHCIYASDKVDDIITCWRMCAHTHRQCSWICKIANTIIKTRNHHQFYHLEKTPVKTSLE